MFQPSFENIDEAHLQSLCQDQIEESIKLEFKRELDLSSSHQKAEAAKDVSAMANTVGGRVLYGIDEQILPDGSTGASSIRPLTDASIETRLENVLLSSIHPRPRFRTRRVPVNNNTGFVLIVEVRPAYSSDLHMVSGFKKYRFYRRSEKRTIPMTEPEIREAYMRIAASRQALDALIEETVTSELDLVPRTQESVLVIPWFGHHDLVNPQQLGSSFGTKIANEALSQGDWHYEFSHLEVFSGGYRCYGPSNSPPRECQRYASIRRNGLLHLADASAKEYGENLVHIDLRRTLQAMIAASVAAQFILDEVSYGGPVRIIHRLNVQTPFYLKDPQQGQNFEEYAEIPPIDPGVYAHSVPEAHLTEGRGAVRLALVELLHRVFQTKGEPSCPWFEPSGSLKPDMDHFLWPHLCQYLAE